MIQDLDDLFLKLGGLSTLHILSCTAAIIAGFGSGFSTQLAVFSSAVPEFRCYMPYNLSGVSEDEVLNLTTPYSTKIKGYDRCYQFKIIESKINSSIKEVKIGKDLVPCENGYIFSKKVYEETTISEWDLVCDRKYLDTLVNSLVCVGYFLGSALSGPLCDRFGRKKTMLVFTILFMTSSVLTCSATTIESFIILRCFSTGLGIASYISTFTYAIEICPKKSRTTLEFIINVSQTLSHVVTPIFGYFFRKWRIVGLVGNLLSLPFIFFYPFIPESPRWLLSKFRLKKAKNVCKRFAKSNNEDLEDEDWNELLEVNKNNTIVSYNVVDLFRRKRSRFLSIMVFLAWCTNYLIYYGMVLNIGRFFGNIYVISTINAGIELCGNLFILLNSYFEKRNILVVSFFSASLACIASTLCDVFSNGNTSIMYLSVCFALLGKMNSQINHVTLYSLTTDIYPTLARGTGLGLGSMSARFGGLLAPLIIQLQLIAPWITQATFALSALIGSISSIFFPATKNASLFMTLKNAEDFYRDKMIAYNKIFGKKTGSKVEVNQEELKLTANI